MKTIDILTISGRSKRQLMKNVHAYFRARGMSYRRASEMARRAKRECRTDSHGFEWEVKV